MAARHTTVFFRDDDVGGLTPALQQFVDLLIAEGVPCNYQVVPMHLTEASAEMMRERCRRFPDLVVLNQHGYEHQYILPSGERTYEEFGGRRPFDDQLAALARGRQMLVEMLGPEFSGDVFTPPCHKYDEKTLDALFGLGFRVLSAGLRPDRASRTYYGVGRALSRVNLLNKRVSYHGRKTPHHIAELSCAVDVDPEIAGRPAKPLQALIAEFERARASDDVVGVMLHHETYTSDAKCETLRAFCRWIRARPEVTLATIENIAAKIT